jgi:hypothetical protein
MIKKYNDFISESINQSHFNSDYDEFMKIYNTKIVPKLGEVKEVTNFMLDGVLTKIEQNNFNYHKGKLKDYRDDFFDSILSLDRFYGSSFSKLAGSKDNPDEDFEEMQKILNRAGFTLDVIGKLFNPVVSVFLHQDFNNFVASGLDDQSRYIDMYLYKLNEKFNLNTTVWLGGDGWGDALDEMPEEEYIIKYSYGYHKTKYGQMFLEQMKLSKEDFVDRAYEYLKDYLKENVYSRIYSDIKKMAQVGYASQITEIKLNIDDYIIIDDDRFIIRYLEMCDDFNDETDNKYENTSDPDWFKETILTNMRIFSHLNIQDTGEELIFND